MGRGKELTTHHLLCQNPDTNTTYKWSNDPINLLRIKWNVHDAIHTLFVNKMIADQMLTCVNISEKALIPEVRDWLVDVLTKNLDPKDPTLRYREECIR